MSGRRLRLTILVAAVMALAVSLAEGQELGQAVRIANAAGALAVTRSGAQDSMPLREDVYELVRSRQSDN